MKLASMITLYHPDDSVIRNVLSYVDDVDILYVFDNSETPSEEVVSKLRDVGKKINYVSFGENRGLSYALNFTMEKARKVGYDFLLTLDQDSFFNPDDVKAYKDTIEKLSPKTLEKGAMFSVDFDNNSGGENVYQLIEVAHTITSGSIVNVHLAQKLGGFDEQLFIDEVDKEFCYRARRRGYAIYKLPWIHLHHEIGNPSYYKIGSFRFQSSNHNAQRKYYITRNRIFVLRNYPDVRKEYMIWLIKMAVKTAIAEPNRMRKLRAILYGTVVSRFFRKFISSASKYRHQMYGFSSSAGCSNSILNRCSMSI